MYGIVGDPSDASPSCKSIGAEQPALVPKRKRRAVQREGNLRSFLVVGGNDGLWSKDFSDSAPPGWPQCDGSEVVVVGVAVASWALRRDDAQAQDALHERLRRLSTRRCRATQLFGFVEYQVVEFIAFMKPLVADGRAAARRRVADLPRETTVLVLRPGQPEPAFESTFGGALEHAAVLGANARPTLMTVVGVAPTIAARAREGRAACLHVVPNSQRLDRAQLLEQEPSSACLSAFRQECGAMGAATKVCAKTRLPKWEAALADPYLVLDWLGASSFVKDIRQSPAAADAFAKLFGRNSGLSRAELMSNLASVGYSTLRRARCGWTFVQCWCGAGSGLRCLLSGKMFTSTSFAMHRRKRALSSSRRLWMCLMVGASAGG